MTLLGEAKETSVREFGSEFPLVQVPERNPVADVSDMVFLRSGRSALRYVGALKKNDAHSVLMPALCCASMVDPFIQLGYRIVYYNLKDGFRVDVEDVEKKAKDNPGCLLLYMNHFGFPALESSTLERLRSHYHLTVIKDATHDLLDRGVQIDGADYVVASLRKWCALPDGALVRASSGTLESAPSQDNNRFVLARREAMEAKAQYLVSGDVGLKKSFLLQLRQCNDELDADQRTLSMSVSSRRLLASVDFETIRNIRRKNAMTLSAGFSKLGLTVLYHEESAPIYIVVKHRDRDALQARLSTQDLYCPVLWPLPQEARSFSRFAREFEESMLAVPCDQRYGEADMETILKIVSNQL